MHYLAVLCFMNLWIKVLILSSQLLVGSYSFPFVANSISMMIRMQTMHLSSISVTSVGATLALVVILLVWQYIILQNTTWVHVIPCWWSHSSCNAYQMHTMTFQTVRWLISCMHSMVQWSTVLCDTPWRGTSCYMPQFWWSGLNCGPQKQWVPWASHQRAPCDTFGWPPWCPKTDSCTVPKGLVAQAVWDSYFLCLFMHDLCTNKKQYCSPTWFTAAPSSPRILLSFMEHWFYHWFTTLSWM